MRHYFEFSAENESCFWEITLQDRIVRTRHGQKDTQGVVTERIYQSADMAAKEYDKMVQEKKEDDSCYFRLGDDYRL